MLKLTAAAVAAAWLALAPHPVAAAQTCTEAYTVCSRPCWISRRAEANPQACGEWCNRQRAICMRTGRFSHIGNQFVGLQRR
jgi:hypothetical protein